MEAMTGKLTTLKNKFIIQLTPKYRIRIDRMNATLMVKKTTKNSSEAVDDEIENGFIPLGYYNARNPEYLVRALITDHIVSEGSKNHLKLQEFADLFNTYVSKLTKSVGKVTNYADGLTSTLNEQEQKIIDLEKKVRIMKGQITKLKKGPKQAKCI